MKILCIEDDESLAKLLEQSLLGQHYQVDLATDGQKGLDLAEVIPYDLILVDWGLPKLDGLSFCQQLRSDRCSSLALNCDTPIILMTALDKVTNKVMGLDTGADDYITKPFDLEELLARIRALLRRKSGIHSPILTWGDLLLNPNNCLVTYQGQEIKLKSKEYEILELFLRNPDQIFPINRLLDCLWRLDNPPSEGAVRAHIKGLRQKLKSAGVADIFQTIYKLGYRLKSPDQKQPKKPEKQPKSGFSPLIPDLQRLWREYQPSYCDRLKIIQQTVTALQMGTLTLEQQHQSEREAHTLIGSLGTFGLDEASHICRQIQQAFKNDQLLQVNQANQLEQLVKKIQDQIEGQNYPEPIVNIEPNNMDNHPKTNHQLMAELETLQSELTTLRRENQERREQQIVIKIALLIRQCLNLDEILQTTVTEVRQKLQCDRVIVYQFRHQKGLGFVAKEAVSEAAFSIIGTTIEDSCFEESWIERYYQGRVRAIEDINTESEMVGCYREFLEQLQIRANLVLPIIFNDYLWGLLIAHHCTAPRFWRASEVQLMSELAIQVGIAVQQAELLAALQNESRERQKTAIALQQMNQELEERIKQRTAEIIEINLNLQQELRDRQEAEAALQEFHRRWRSLLDNVQLIVVQLDKQGKVEYINPFFEKLTQFTAEEVIGQNWFTNFIPNYLQTSLISVFEEMLPQGRIPHYQNPIITKTGEERIIAWVNTVLRDTSGQNIGTISIGEDITERYHLERMKSEFVSIVSHELRTPLTPIQVALSLLAEKIIEPSSPEGENTIKIALNGVDRLVRLVNDILDLERLEAGKMRLEKSPCDTANLINTAIMQMQEMANQAGIILEATPSSFQIEADPDRLLQVLLNLLSNALKFSPPNSTVSLTVELIHKEKSFVLFSIRDQGRGIPANSLEQIFDRFGQIDASDSRDKGGTGLGLPICRSIVEQHGGKIWAESVLGQSSTFFFIIPILEVSNLEK